MHGDHADLLGDGGRKTSTITGSKVMTAGGKAPLPMAKRGNSLNPARMKTSSAADLSGL